MENAVVLWTGGKDSCLALHLVRDNLERHINIVALATFVPPGNVEFRAHPQTEMRNQAKKLGLDIHFIEIHEPYRESYVEALKGMKRDFGASIVITGDIDLVKGHPNWMEECCQGLDIEVHRPLWQRSREWIMEELLARNIQARISFINHPSIPVEWLNRIIDRQFLSELKALSASSGIDLTGENGEYHTMVVAAPAFA
jgi:diphthine-ammonia ligase